MAARHPLQEMVIDEFSYRPVLEKYIITVEEGFWDSEKHFLEKYFVKKGRVLDIGCGTGRTTIELHKQGYLVTGIDITPAMVREAKKIAEAKKLKITYTVG